MSDVTDSSLEMSTHTQGAVNVFTLHDEKNAMMLLRKIHQSTISPDEKNELRDAIFIFRNNPASEITPEFIAKFAEYGFVLGAEVPTEPQAMQESFLPSSHIVQGIGTTRPSPRFASMTVPPVITQQQPVVQKEASVVSQKKVTPATPLTQPVPPPVKNVITQQEVPNEVVVPVEPVVPSPVEPTPVEQVKNMIPPSVSEVSAVTSPSAPERIKEIKKIVNQLVGNPVNLIDTHNDIGREYMNALLDAMKKNNGGTTVEATQAMDRLELAFLAVTKVSKDPHTTGADESVTPAVTTEQVPEEQSEPIPTTIVPKEETSVQTTTPTPITEPPVESIDEPEVVLPDKVPEKVVEITPPMAEPVSPVVPDTTPTPTKDTTPSGGIMSVAKEKQIQDLLVSQKQESATTDQQKKNIEIAAMDPLMTPEVTAGLQQLLLEWSLFKSSGFFGTGPGGMEHPLYKQLAVLNMTAIVAGRYEGATSHIKRSITDYMNGWRYEEGILQVQGEMFEHYLRRVIKHILKKRAHNAAKMKK